MKIELGKLYKIQRTILANRLFVLSVFIAILGSMNVWFLIPLYSVYPIIAFVLAYCSYLVSRNQQEKLFVEEYWIIPCAAFLLLTFYQSLNNSLNVNAYIKNLFSALYLFLVFKYDKRRLLGLTTIFAKALGGFLLVSYPFFFLYLIGFPLPNSDLQFNDGFYYFSNYYMFLVDDRTIFSIFPRFQSVFLEPTYLGSTTALILFTQRGCWKKWYNVSILSGLLLSFSLAGYVFLFIIVFLNLWINREKIISKVIATLFVFGLIIGVAFVYNDGDNMLHNFILLRMEVDDGEFVGNNRVTANFDKEFDGYISSADVVFGRDYDYSVSGDSGYKVFIYDYGILGAIFLFIFYLSAFWKYNDVRASVSALILMILMWWVDGFVVWLGRILLLYFVSMRELINQKSELK